MLSLPPRFPPKPSPSGLTAVVFCSFLAQKGPNDLKLQPEEYSVMIGSYPCNISFNNDQLFHCTINGLLSSSEGELPVTVSTPVKRHKHLFFRLLKIPPNEWEAARRRTPSSVAHDSFGLHVIRDAHRNRGCVPNRILPVVCLTVITIMTHFPRHG